ncbi:MAG: hypothetical protein QNL04_11255 [SAR324 cluster bacterium]|nr:hypothetical protein [SAR324 cluster bacterium]
MKLLLSAFFIFALPCFAFSATLSVTYSFKGKAPKAALLYFTQDKSNKSAATLSQNNKKFDPLLITIAKGKSLSITNNDGVDHNVFVNNQQQGIKFDIGLKKPGEVAKIPAQWPKDELIRLSCKIHSKMRAWVAVLDSKYSLVSRFNKSTKSKSGDYQFTLKGIPSEYTKIKILIPSYQTLDLDLTKNKLKKFPLHKRRKTKGFVQIILSP